MTLITDIHSHTPGPERVYNLDPTEPAAILPSGQLCSAGIHPWNAALATPDAIARLDTLAREPFVVAIGETGIDRRRGAPPEVQKPLFDHHIALARELRKPLIIHCVGAWDEIIAACRGLDIMKIIHGFRGKPELARRLVGAGFHLSLGNRFNPAVPAAVDPALLLRETD